MNILWLVLLVCSVSAVVGDDEAIDELLENVIVHLLPNEALSFWKEYKISDQQKTADFGNKICTSNTETIIKNAENVSPEFKNKVNVLVAYYMKKYNSLGHEAKGYLDQFKKEFCESLRQLNDGEGNMEKLRDNFVNAQIVNYMMLSLAAQDDIEKQFPFVIVAKMAFTTQSLKKLLAAADAFLPTIVAEFVKSAAIVDTTNIEPYMDCSIGMKEFLLRVEEVSPDFADKTEKLYDYLKTKYNALSDDGKKFFKEMKPRACSILKSKNSSKTQQILKELVVSEAKKYSDLPKSTRDDIEEQFSVMAVVKPLYAVVMKSGFANTFSPKFRRFS